MPHSPWWIDRVPGLLLPLDLTALALGALWRLREQLNFVRENVEPGELALDLGLHTGAAELWAAFGRREEQVRDALAVSGEARALALRSGVLGPVAFRDGWESLGFERHPEGSGTPADDFLDGLLHLSRVRSFLAPAPFGLLNLATRAERVADFLKATEPGVLDVVFDLGSGSGKLAVTVAASTACTVRGVELEPSYTEEARGSASWLGLKNLTFDAADVRDVDFTSGTVFYLYYPFHGPVARGVAQRLGALARQKDITVYASGPVLDYGEFFLSEVASGALSLTSRRGEFGEVLHLVSARA